jgi:hypothetical protein
MLNRIGLETAEEGPMKRFVLAILVAAVPAAAADIRFEGPAWDAPRYQVRLALEVKAAPLTLKEVLLDGVRIEPAPVYRAGKPVDAAKPLGPGAYEVDAFHPWFVSETKMTVEKDLGVIAVRNDEMVLYKELFDGLMYRDTGGEVVARPLEEMPETPFGLVHIAPPDVPWAGLVNTAEKYGFFSLRLAAAASNLDVAGDFAHKAGTYFYAPSDGDYVYWVRPLIYTWADYVTNTLVSFVPKGSFFYEKNAYVVLRLNDGTPRELDALLRRLRDPLRVF